MKRFLLLAATLALGATAANAAGINFAWDQCLPEGGTTNRTFACNVTTGTNTMVGSFSPSADQPNFVGIEAVVDLQTEGSALPDWWQFFNSGACRQTSLSTSFDFTSSPATQCVDPWQGLGAGGVAAYQTNATSPPNPYPDPARARVKLAAALADPSPLSANTEYYGFQLRMNNLKSTGTGSCAGCTTPATLVLNEIKSAENTGSFERIFTPITNICITWNSSTVPCATLPAQNKSWGKIKSMYR